MISRPDETWFVKTWMQGAECPEDADRGLHLLDPIFTYGGTLLRGV